MSAKHPIIHDSGWHRASTIWSALAFVASALAATVVGASGTRATSVEWRPLGIALCVAALLGLASAYALRHTRWRYRLALILATTSLLAVTVFGGVFLGGYFFPACLCATLAIGTEALSRRAT